MPLFRKKGLFESNRVLEVPVEQIVPNPNQPRSLFSPQGLDELCQSIQTHGILQPLSVRRVESGFELVSGERRLRAAKLAEMATVPCIVVAVDEEASALLALVENLQRRDLDFVEEALALSQLRQAFRLSQEEVAQKIGKSQSAVANKLRLLRLCPDALTLLRSNQFTERHARALLRLEGDEAQLFAAQQVVAAGLTVSATEAMVEDLLVPCPVKPPRAKLLLRDVRLFLNTLDRSIAMVKSAGIAARCRREEHDGEIVLTITLPKSPTAAR